MNTMNNTISNKLENMSTQPATSSWTSQMDVGKNRGVFPTYPLRVKEISSLLRNTLPKTNIDTKHDALEKGTVTPFKHGNTAFCNRVFLKVGSWIPIGFGKQQNERFGAWATKSFFALFPAACVFVTCVSCDERPTYKFCPRIYHWVSVRFGFSFVLGKTFSSGTNR